jgi:secretion/DNA translocation related TadE-like protein
VTRSREQGAATVLVVAMAAMLMFVAVGLAAVGGLVTAVRKAQAAADLAALGGATAPGEACAEAAYVAGANAASLDACRVEGGVKGAVVSVVVSVPGPDVPWARRARVTAEARAGPG